MSTIKKSIAAIAALGAIAFGAATIADAASNSGKNGAANRATSPGPTGPPPAGAPPMPDPLSAEDAAKVKAAALAEVPGATVLRTEAGGPYPTPYHAHVKVDGKRKVVLVDEDFEATGVQADRGPGRRGGPRGGMPPRGGFRPGGPPPGMHEEALTGETKEKVEAAVLAEYPGATILRTETNGDGTAPYESHIATTDGRELEVLVSDAFEVVDAREHP